MKLSRLKDYILLYGTFMIYSLSTLCAKYASQQDDLMKTYMFFGLEIFCLGLYALAWQQVLNRFLLITAMANKGIIVVINLIWSVLLFRERISLFNIVGTLVIILGIWMISRDE